MTEWQDEEEEEEEGPEEEGPEEEKEEDDGKNERVLGGRRSADILCCNTIHFGVLYTFFSVAVVLCNFPMSCEFVFSFLCW